MSTISVLEESGEEGELGASVVKEIRLYSKTTKLVTSNPSAEAFVVEFYVCVSSLTRIP